MISPYARRGYVDHQVLSFDAYDKFIEDDFLGRRCTPLTFAPTPNVAKVAHLSSHHRYRFRIAAINAIGIGLPSDTTATIVVK